MTQGITGCHPAGFALALQAESSTRPGERKGEEEPRGLPLDFTKLWIFGDLIPHAKKKAHLDE
jgi:hypothetical protein